MRRLLPSLVDDVDLVDAYAPSAELHLRANMAATVDGAVEADGRSASVSSEADKRVFGVLRDWADVILVGAGTMRAERYRPSRPSEARQSSRQARGLRPVPPIAVVTASLDLDPDAEFFTAADVRPVLLTTARADASAFDGRADVVVCGDERVDLPSAVSALRAAGHGRILCEGGPSLLGQLVADGLLDELCLTLSPLLAGPGHRTLVAGPPHAPRQMRLAHVLEEEGSLFLRYDRG